MSYSVCFFMRTTESQLMFCMHRRPLTVVSAVEERLDVVNTFLAHPAPANTLQQHLAALPDADRLLPKAAAALRALQEQQSEQQQQQGGHMQQQQQQLFDPNDTCAVEAKRAAWKALAALPACLMG
jgi:DNA mismatch repair ATPase MutS